MELEQELQARIFLHKVAIVKSRVAHAYITAEKARGGLILAEPCLEDNAMEYANTIVQKLLEKGKLNNAYDEAWEKVKDYIPDNYSIMGINL